MRAFCVGFIVLFLMMLIIPLVCIDLTRDRVSVEENRALANPPKLADIKNHPGTFIWQFEEWFRDSTGFREQLMPLYDLYNKNVRFNGNYYLDGQFIVLAGERGHHYNMEINGKLIRKFQGKQVLSGEQLSIMADKLKGVKTYLDRKDIPLILMLCADKETIYPEYFPKSIKPGPEPVQLDVITQYLKEHTGIDVFNIRQALLREKNNYLLYPLIDTRAHYYAPLHYNEIGAFFAYRELMTHINRYFPEIIPYEFSDLVITCDTAGIPDAALKGGTAYTRLDNAFFDDLEFFRSNNPWFASAFENPDADGPVILFFYDSYAGEEYIGKYLAQHFSKAIFIHYQAIEHIDAAVLRYGPDIVIIDSAERSLGDLFMESIGKIPELPAGEQ